MGATVQIKYFNSFIAKRLIQSGANGLADWPGLPWALDGYPIFPLEVGDTASEIPQDWYVEESRIRGGYNNDEVGYGVRAFITEQDDNETVSTSSIIYSGIYNSLTQFNETNVFSVGDAITKSVNPEYGSIQRLYTSDGNLVVFQENKVSRALVNKSAIYSAQGDATVTSSQLVLGQITPYTGEYGISTNPESFAYKGSRLYFTDKNRGSVMRLSRDGLTEISKYGMRDFFRDSLNDISNKRKQSTLLNVNVFSRINSTRFRLDNNTDMSNIELGMVIYNPSINSNQYVEFIDEASPTFKTITFSAPVDDNSTLLTGVISLYKIVMDKAVGGYDNYLDKYVLSIQKEATQTESSNYKTISFNESNNGWTSFWDYKPSFMGTLNASYFSTNGINIWEHYKNTIKGLFYDVQTSTSIVFTFNPNVSFSKNFNTVNYEGDNGWQVDYFLSDDTGIDLSINNNFNNYKDESSLIYSYDEGVYIDAGVTYHAGFNRKQNKYYANLVNKGVLSSGGLNGSISFGQPEQVLPGASMSGIKGYFATVKLSTDNTTNIGGQKTLFAVSSNFV